MKTLIRQIGVEDLGNLRPDIEGSGYETAVKAIIADVKRRGDAALVDMTRKYDWPGMTKSDIEADIESAQLALKMTDPRERAAMELAAENIVNFHMANRPISSSYAREDGTRLGQMMVPLDTAGIYVPGGSASYPSTLMMCALAARVAGVRMVYVCTPPGKDGKVGQGIMAAAALCGVDKVFKVGGAQAVAAMAYSTETIPRADIIVGPGNAWVTAAKKAVMGDVRIDMLAGPSELMVIADGTADADLVAADLLAQAEHDKLACAVLVSTSADLIAGVRRQLVKKLSASPRHAIAEESLTAFGASVLVRSVEEAIDAANTFAPEHLELCLEGASRYAAKVKNAGTVFVGQLSAEAMGDYVAGPSHVLPTMGTARSFETLSSADFMKRINVVEYSEEGFLKDGPAAATIAQMEGLFAHGESVKARLERLSDGQVDVNGATLPGNRRIKLDANENCADVPPGVKARMLSALAGVPFNRYPTENSDRLRAALSDYFCIDKDRFVAGVGSDELIMATMLGLKDMVDEVVAPGPTFSMYRGIANICGLKYREIGLDAKGYPIESELRMALGNERALVFLCIPNNPTGTDWEKMARSMLPGSKAYVVLDQAYAEFCGSDMNDLAYGKTIVLRTFSKARGLAGIRVGYSISDPETAKLIISGKLPFNLSSLCEELAVMALKEEALMCSNVDGSNKRRSRLAADLKSMGYGAGEGSCNFVTVNTENGRASQLCRKLAANGILTRTFQDRPDILRITVGTETENRAVIEALGSLKGGKGK